MGKIIRKIDKILRKCYEILKNTFYFLEGYDIMAEHEENYEVF